MPACIDSLLHQGELGLEMILINDGSTDCSGLLADQYATKDNRIKVIHQENRGVSAARNVGLKLAQGEYIAFVDSDDWVKEMSLCELYNEAIKYHADIVQGNLFYTYQDEIIEGPYQPIPEDTRNIPFLGKDGFIRWSRTQSYIPNVCNYIYRRKYLEKIQARFEDVIMYEDELWGPIVICQAQKVIAVDIDFYFYRQREGSVLQSSHLKERLDAYFSITDKLMAFADRFDFSGKDRELKNWIYVNIFCLYFQAFRLLSGIKDTSYMFPAHHLDIFCRDCWEMMPHPQAICRDYVCKAEAGLKKYKDWRTSNIVASVDYKMKFDNKLMLIYNTVSDDDFYLKDMEFPADWVITTDRRYFQQADAIVFHLPTLQEELEDDLNKPQGQIWVSWYMESESENSWVKDPEIRDTFDLQICYKQNDDLKLANLCWKLDEKLFEADKALCPCCGKTFGRFVNFDFNRPYEFGIERFKETYKNVVCPFCSSMPRHRIACYYFDGICPEGNIIMFGAEDSIKKYFDRNNIRYITADLFDRKAHLKMDIQDIQLPDEQWDLIICNHVLEHVPDYKKALMELQRVLKKGGILEITVPTDRNLETVYEDHRITTIEDRIRNFGQFDHLRIFGNDFEKTLTDTGFSVEIVDGKTLPAEIVGVIGPANYDDNRVYICKKNNINHYDL